MIQGPIEQANTTGEARFEIRRVEHFVSLRVTGPVTQNGSANLWRQLHDLIEDQGNRRLILDLTDATAIDEVCVKRLIDVRLLMRERGGEIRLRLPPHDRPDSVA